MFRHQIFHTLKINQLNEGVLKTRLTFEYLVDRSLNIDPLYVEHRCKSLPASDLHIYFINI